jgi:hypothetical protein
LNISQTVSLLNNFLAIDPNAMNRFFGQCVEVNDEFAEHPRSVVNAEQEVSVLGIINSVVAEGGHRLVCVRDDVTGKILRFQEGEGYEHI